MRDRAIRQTLLVEGACDAVVLAAKLVVAMATGSAAVSSDAVHSLGDLANNGVALVALRLASAPPDREHPYGHRRYESLAVFLLATLLAVLAVEIALRSFAADREVVQHGWSLALMLGVWGLNLGLAVWQGRRARWLNSDLLRADARHSYSDALVTPMVIGGWQLAAQGRLWLDTALSLTVSALILVLAYDLFRRAIPILVDHIAADPEAIEAVVNAVPGVRSTRSVRSRAGSDSPRIDVVVGVDPSLSTAESHTIADSIERSLRERFGSEEVTVHVEPE
jgi:cation diffusion facilitator family transporter